MVETTVIVVPQLETLSDFFSLFFTFCLMCIYYFHAKNSYIMQEKIIIVIKKKEKNGCQDLVNVLLINYFLGAILGSWKNCREGVGFCIPIVPT